MKWQYIRHNGKLLRSSNPVRIVVLKSLTCYYIKIKNLYGIFGASNKNLIKLERIINKNS